MLKEEKNKTKLKAKYKDRNITKSRNMMKTNLAVSARELNIKELLSYLNHSNTQSRPGALNRLKELIEADPKVLEHNLVELVHRVTPLVVDVEKNVRHESIKTLHLMLSKAHIQRIDSFFDILCTYLRRAMTNANSGIQEDSLLFLETLLVCTPTKVAQVFHKVIPNFLDMMSKLRFDSKPERTPTVNLGSQITSVKWRVKVLHSLKNYLNEFVEYNDIQEYKRPHEADQTVVFEPSKSNYNSVFNPIYTQNCQLSCFSIHNFQDTVPLAEAGTYISYYSDTLMPWLIETWLEVCPNVSSVKNTQTVITEDAASFLKHSLDVIASIWALLKHFNMQKPSSDMQHTFSEKYRKPYLQNFVKPFPYVTNISTELSNVNAQLEDSITDPKLVAQNLEICRMFILLNPNINEKNQNTDMVCVLNYIEITFNKNTSAEINDIIIKILHTLFSKETNNWTKTLSVMGDLFKKIVWAYSNKDLSSSFRQQIFILLCKIAWNNNLVHFQESEAYQSWLKNMPDIYLEETLTMETVDMIHKFVVRKNKTFNMVAGPKLFKIIENLPKLVISDVDSFRRGYYRLFSMLNYVQKWNDESLNLLREQLENDVYDCDYGNYIFDMLQVKTADYE